MRYDLAAMIRRTRNPRRSTITLRAIQPTATMAGDLYAAAYKPVVTAWQQAVARIGEAYGRAVPAQDAAAVKGAIGTAITDSIFDLDAILAALDGTLQQLVINLTPRLREWSVRAEQWHRGQWRRAVLAGTGIDPQTMLGAGDVAETVSAFVSRNVSLIRSVSDETRSKVSDIVLRGYAARTPPRTVAKEMDEAVDLGRKRALRVASDQNSTLAARLDQARQQQAGITAFQWHHSAKKHPRPWHLARQGKEYDWGTLHQIGGPDQIEPNDTPGAPPWCGCRARAVVDLS